MATQWYQAIHASKRFRLGTKKKDVNDNVYVYLKGVASCAAGSWVTYDENFASALLVPNAVGPVAVSMAANAASTTFSWFQVYGNNTISLSDTTAADAALYIDTVAGQVDDAGVAGDWVSGAVSTGASSSGVLPVFLTYPFVCNNGYLT